MTLIIMSHWKSAFTIKNITFIKNISQIIKNYFIAFVLRIL